LDGAGSGSAPQFEGGWLFGDGGSGPSSAAAVVDILGLRFTIAW
jgi:hypothetical protein